MNNKDKKVAFKKDEYLALEISSEFMKTCHNMNIIVQNKGGYSYFINGKGESPNKKIANSTIDHLLNSIHKKELWLFAYKYSIWFSCQTENSLSGDVTYFPWHGRITSHKHTKILGVRIHIINGRVTRNKIDYRSQQGYLMGYEDTKGFIIY